MKILRCLLIAFLLPMMIHPDVKPRDARQNVQSVSQEVRNQVTALLRQIKDPATLDAAARGVSDLGSDGIAALIELLGVEESKWPAMQVLGTIGSGAVPKLIATLESERSPQNAAAA